MNSIDPTRRSSVDTGTVAATGNGNPPKATTANPTPSARAAGDVRLPGTRAASITPGAAPAGLALRRSTVPALTPGQAAKAKADTIWPSGRLDTAEFLRAWGTNDAALARGVVGSAVPPRSDAPQLFTTGRPMPSEITPQTLGSYLREPVGQWPQNRAVLAATVVGNLGRLNRIASQPERQQLHREITLHWHCLSEVEKYIVLESLGTESAALLGDTTRPAGAEGEQHTPVRDWLEHTLTFMPPDLGARLFANTSDEAQQKLAMPFKAVNDDDVRSLLTERFAGLRMTMPLDHVYDYKGFYWGNNRQVATLPPDVAANKKVGILGGGPTGLMAADALNRMGLKHLKVFEQASRIGGRMAARVEIGEDELDPNPYHAGAMRFSTIDGNFYYSFAEHYDVETSPFPNPNSVPTIYLIGGEAPFEATPGEPLPHRLMQEVADEAKAALNALILPIRAARDAGDTARFRQLCDAAKKRFESHTFKSGLRELLTDQGKNWSQEKWDIFGAVGIGVGGYSGYFGTGFLEEFRFLVDERLENHVALVGGADLPLYQMIKDEEGLPEGQLSLEAQQAIKLNTTVTDVKKIDGKYHVTSSNADGKTTTDVFDELIVALPPREVVRLGLTTRGKGEEPLMPNAVAQAVKRANVVGATKMGIGIPPELFDADLLPGNLQGDELFQQSYMVPSEDGGAMFYLSYTLGDNTSKVVGMSKEEQVDLFITTIKGAAAKSPDTPAGRKLTRLAEVLLECRERGVPIQYTNWLEKKHFGGAFNMHEPDQTENTLTVLADLTEPADGSKPTDSAIVVNEMLTFESGFASGAFALGLLAAQKLAVKHGGELPENSPYHQKVLRPV